MFLGSDQGGETAAILFSILANAKRYQIEPFAYVRALLVALSSERGGPGVVLARRLDRGAPGARPPVPSR